MQPIQSVYAELQEIVDSFGGSLRGISAADYAMKPDPGRWSKKEILGHLVDSAQNNLRRFIVGQYEEGPEITYRQDDWVRLSGYQDWPDETILVLWEGLNEQIVRVLSLMQEETLTRTCRFPGGSSATLVWLAGDYIKHLRHHLQQITGGEPFPYP